MTEDDFRAAVLLELRAIRAAVEAPAAAWAMPATARGRRHLAIRSLADALALGPTWACAQAIAAILAGARAAPRGCRDLVAELRADQSCPRSVRQMLRIIAPPVADTADTGDRWRQWPPLRYGGGIATDDEGSTDE
jgi:hypothetical protein